jgi:uncharacterized membrane protein YtjA (UPF0391 family)
MYEWAVIFMILATVAAVFGFAVKTITLVSAAKLIFYVLLALAALSFIAALLPKKKSNNLVIDIKYGD